MVPLANRIPQAFIDNVRSKVNIVDVIGQYTQLVKKADNGRAHALFMMTGILPYLLKKTSKYLIAFHVVALVPFSPLLWKRKDTAILRQSYH